MSSGFLSRDCAIDNYHAYKSGANTVEPQFNKPLYNEVLVITNNFLGPNNSKICGKEPRYDESSLQRTYFATSMVLPYIEVPL